MNEIEQLKERIDILEFAHGFWDDPMLAAIIVDCKINEKTFNVICDHIEKHDTIENIAQSANLEPESIKKFLRVMLMCGRYREQITKILENK